MEEKGPVNYRVSIGMSIILIGIAGIFDLFSIIPLVGSIMAPIFWVGVGAYLWTKGVGFLGWKKIASICISFLIELFPFLQTLPGLVAGIIAVLLVIRTEDKTGLSIVKPMKKGVTPPRIEKRPLNTEGVRMPRRGNIEVQTPNRVTEDEEISLSE
jgi:hypothetical protein